MTNDTVNNTLPRFNLNHKVIIYPNKSGWRKIKALIASQYLLSDEEADKWINARKTSCGGYEEQLWVLISNLHDMFYLGQTYFANTWINLKHE